ncbi:glycosyltransferase family 2 protein [Agromyces protaetiae]|uniref:Glycosyltransferase family 2 protein n=1 Tax=Agromyces protaetiae TaxID=2509455 RepID=A0A4V0YHF8_9MICO|nr:glycosyltransferase [Agromyces protaetiae]QAY74561.1 glycosyltransferase family 2 protein [Agromyces protaetiae]
MFPRVTAFLVVQRGGDRLRRTIAAVQAQTRAVDELLVVLNDADADAAEQAAAAAPGHVLRLQTRVPFGEAVRAGERLLDVPGSTSDALWLLAEDSAPAADALARLVATLETARSVAIAGPEQRSWAAPERIERLGRSITRFGRAVELVSDELDQGQHDELSDVLGVDPAGLLVRHTVWRDLDGFDPGLPVVDDALDFSIRARLAGHRVSVVPEARIEVADSGVAGPPAGGGRTARKVRRQTRAAQLHRRLVYAPAAVVPLHWVSLLPLAVVRSIGLLLAKAPGAIAGELGAALAAMFSFGKVARARRTLRRQKTVGWSAVAPLRVQPDEVRRRRRAAAEARRARASGRAEELQFLGTGGGWVLLGSAVASVALFSWLIGASGVAGGALQPLSGSFGELWRNAAYGWRDVGVGFVGAADPFSGVLAVLGSFAFWAPSVAVAALWLVAVPAAALGAWFAASRLTERGSLRALAAVAWAFAPPFVVALADGRPGAVLTHILLGWLVYASIGAASSWAAAATASLLLASVVASAPSLAPALAVGWILAIVAGGRASIRYVLLPLPAAVLAAPLVLAQLSRGTPLALLADAGAPVPSAVPEPLWRLLGFPGGSDGGWGAVLEGMGILIDPVWVATALAAPLVIIAGCAVGVAIGSSIRLRGALLALAAVAAGVATATGAARLSLATVGADQIAVWTGAGQSLAVLGVVIAAVIALDGLRRGAPWLAALAAVAAVGLVVPSLVALATGSVAVHRADARTLPAFVTAEAANDPRVATLRLEPLAGGGLRAWLEHGAGTTLDDQSTLASTRTEPTADEQELAELAGNLASRSGFDPEAAIDRFGTSFVLLGAPADGAADDRAALATEERARIALDGTAALVPVGDTAFGVLWRFADAPSPAPAAAIPPNAGGGVGVLWTVVQVVVVLAALLLSIPTGVGRETDRRPVRTREPKAKAKTAKAKTAKSAEPATASELPDAPAEPSADGESETSATEPSATETSDTETSEPAQPASAGADRGGDDAR